MRRLDRVVEVNPVSRAACIQAGATGPLLEPSSPRTASPCATSPSPSSSPRSAGGLPRAAASETIVAHGGTITHHHAVGRLHRPWYDRERDPRGILNPGVLVGP
ncbi:FAD-linked oxidase C-terminal domain-containing protein [Archangium sp.]|uniref:FAD-linked oxidase C-terminal domain-containing protein n=1 Tax=Archangium sp. TaxID=1872627 RepID=UPI002D4FA8A6|nr:FAD-linked oxidase C-terminal domain-containing protein [Archangium sp.]HYO57781.1 FAD-linked oxidase C-terminal domain-containing protein [Archangium sp.]